MRITLLMLCFCFFGLTVWSASRLSASRLPDVDVDCIGCYYQDGGCSQLKTSDACKASRAECMWQKQPGAAKESCFSIMEDNCNIMCVDADKRNKNIDNKVENNFKNKIKKCAKKKIVDQNEENKYPEDTAPNQIYFLNHLRKMGCNSPIIATERHGNNLFSQRTGNITYLDGTNEILRMVGFCGQNVKILLKHKMLDKKEEWTLYWNTCADGYLTPDILKRLEEIAKETQKNCQGTDLTINIYANQVVVDDGDKTKNAWQLKIDATNCVMSLPDCQFGEKCSPKPPPFTFCIDDKNQTACRSCFDKKFSKTDMNQCPAIQNWPESLGFKKQ